MKIDLPKRLRTYTLHTPRMRSSVLQASGRASLPGSHPVVETVGRLSEYTMEYPAPPPPKRQVAWPAEAFFSSLHRQGKANPPAPAALKHEPDSALGTLGLRALVNATHSG